MKIGNIVKTQNSLTLAINCPLKISRELVKKIKTTNSYVPLYFVLNFINSVVGIKKTQISTVSKKVIKIDNLFQLLQALKVDENYKYVKINTKNLMPFHKTKQV